MGSGMGDLGEILTGPAGALGFGGVAGVLVGYAAKKLAKAVAVVLGLLFILLQLLVHEGFISVNWDTVQATAEGAWRNPQGQTLADRAWAIVIGNLPFGGGFVAGFALGFKIG